jgi:hypothetical protein
VHWLDFNKEILILEMHGTNIKIIYEGHLESKERFAIKNIY